MKQFMSNISIFVYDPLISGALPNILDYYNKQFYSSTLIATVCGSTSKEAIQLPTLSRLLPQCSNVDGKQPFGITFVNVEGKNERQENKKSWENREEATIVCLFCCKSIHKMHLLMLLLFDIDRYDHF